MVFRVARPDDMRRTNRQRILATLRNANAASRTDIAALTGLSAATVSSITSDLLDEGVLCESGAAHGHASMRGRPKIALAPNPKVAAVAAVLLQFNTIRASIHDYGGAAIGESVLHFDTLAADCGTLRGSLEQALAAALEEAGDGHRILRGIAIGVQGVTDVAGTRMLWSPIVSHKDMPVRQWMTDTFGVATQLSNDCDLLARALNWRDPERYGRNFAAILLAHGVGMGLNLRGAIINGTVSSGSEFGHMPHVPGGALCRCGRRGCIEAYASDYAIERRALGRDPQASPPGLMHAPDIASIARAARRGDAMANVAIREAGTAVGYGLASLYALVDPFPVALIGSVSEASDLMEPAIRAALAETMAGQRAKNITIDWLSNEQELMLEGCAIGALLELDREIAQASRETAEVMA